MCSYVRPEVGNERTGNNTLLPEQTQNGRLAAPFSWATNLIAPNYTHNYCLCLAERVHLFEQTIAHNSFSRSARFDTFFHLEIFCFIRNLNSLHPPATSKNNLCVTRKKNGNSSRLTDCKQFQSNGRRDIPQRIKTRTMSRHHNNRRQFSIQGFISMKYANGWSTGAFW